MEMLAPPLFAQGKTSNELLYFTVCYYVAYRLPWDILGVVFTYGVSKGGGRDGDVRVDCGWAWKS